MFWVLERRATGSRRPGSSTALGGTEQTLRYIAAFYEAWGETLAYRNSAATAEVPFWFRFPPRRIWPRLVVWGVLYRLCRFVAPAPVWVKYLEAYSWNKGMSRYWLHKRIEMARRSKAEANASDIN